MVCKARKGFILKKEGAKQLAAATVQTAKERARRDDHRWKRVLGKMAAAKKEKFAALEKRQNRGKTRRSLTKRPGQRKADTIAYECTIHIAKLIKGSKFASRAPRAIKKIREFTHRLMRTKDNRIDASINNHIWSRGVKGVPARVRVRIERKVENKEEGGKRKHLYSVISHVETPSVKGLLTEKK
jgi:large subunit ribosomal protein L31e